MVTKIAQNFAAEEIARDQKSSKPPIKTILTAL
jgi:hypothetical protein